MFLERRVGLLGMTFLASLLSLGPFAVGLAIYSGPILMGSVTDFIVSICWMVGAPLAGYFFGMQFREGAHTNKEQAYQDAQGSYLIGSMLVVFLSAALVVGGLLPMAFPYSFYSGPSSADALPIFAYMMSAIVAVLAIGLMIKLVMDYREAKGYQKPAASEPAPAPAPAAAPAPAPAAAPEADPAVTQAAQASGQEAEAGKTHPEVTVG